MLAVDFLLPSLASLFLSYVSRLPFHTLRLRCFVLVGRAVRANHVGAWYAPCLAIVEVTESGSTIRAHGLKIV